MLYGSTQKPSQVHLLSLAPSIGSWSLGHTYTHTGQGKLAYFWVSAVEKDGRFTLP